MSYLKHNYFEHLNIGVIRRRRTFFKKWIIKHTNCNENFTYCCLFHTSVIYIIIKKTVQHFQILITRHLVGLVQELLLPLLARILQRGVVDWSFEDSDSWAGSVKVARLWDQLICLSCHFVRLRIIQAVSSQKGTIGETCETSATDGQFCGGEEADSVYLFIYLC